MVRVRGVEIERGPVNFRAPSVSIRLRWFIAYLLVTRTLRLARWLLRHPMQTGTAVLGLWLWHVWVTVSPWPIAAGAALLAVLLAGWWWRWPELFAQQVTWRARGWWRRLWVYRVPWQAVMSTTRLTEHIGVSDWMPRLLRVRSTGSVDLVTVRMLPGQILADYAEVAKRLASTYGASECRVRSHQHKRDRLVLWFLIRDPLTTTVDPLPPADRAGRVDFKALPVGLREDGLTYKLRLLGTHLLIAGATGAGKSGVLWAIFGALGPAIKTGLVQVWALDPKGGMELASGRRLFARFYYGGDDTVRWEATFADALDEAVAILRARQTKLRGWTRLLKPTLADPFIVIVIDELVSLTGYVTDREAKKRIASSLSLLLSQGRAVGITVVGAVADPGKDVLPIRDLFPTRLCLRVTEDDQVRMVLSDSARKRGARCDEISDSLPGVGFALVDGVTEPVRLRIGHYSDERVTELVQAYAPRSTVQDTSNGGGARELQEVGS
jgi:DNA segregation ATPase FtsK/SpoIIIE, S-DNA-T family